MQFLDKRLRFFNQNFRIQKDFQLRKTDQKFKYLNILCNFCNICTWTLQQFLSKFVTEKIFLVKSKSIPDKAKYTLPRLIEECKSLLPRDFIFQQDGAPAHTAKLAQDWIVTNCSELIRRAEWPSNSSDVNPLDYHVWGVMLEHYETFHPKPKNTDGLKKVL